MMNEKLNLVMARVFNLPVDQVSSQMSMENVGSWDSLAHVKLIYELEKEFAITLQPAEAISLLSYTDIESLLSKKI